MLDYSVYQSNLYQLNAGQTFLRQLYDLIEKDSKNKRIINDRIRVCYKTEVENCLEYKDFQTCQKCVIGYYLKKGKCEQNPQEKIANCSKYLTETKCLNCEQGYYLKSSIECAVIQESQYIENCKEYRNDASSVQCKHCNDNYYLQSNMCKQRENQQIENCYVLNPIEDNCIQCNTNYVLTTNKFCAMQIPNCLTQNSSKTSDGTYTSYCTKCSAGFYLNSEKQCQAGTIQNCEIFFEGRDACSKCQNEYFLDNDGNCFPHDQIPYCEKYSNTRQNICEICEDGFFGLEVINKCVDRQQIPYCAQYTFYNDNSSCEKCQDGFYLRDGYCQNIPINNCKQYDGQNCIECLDNLVLIQKIIDQDENKQIECVQPFEYIYQNCSFESNLNDKSNNQKCYFCDMNHLPYKNDKDFVCIDQYRKDETGIDLFYDIEGCLAYDGYGFCVRCQPGRFLLNGGIQCVYNCNDMFYTFTIQITDSVIEMQNVNTCGISLQNESIKAPSVQDGQAITVQCKDWITVTKNLEGANTEILYSNISINNNGNQWVQDPLQVTNEVDCPVYQSLAKINGNEVNQYTNSDQCELYYDFGFKEYGCIKCPFGMRGSYTNFAQPALGKSSLGQCSSMIECESGIHYKNINPYWNQFFSCHKCFMSSQIPVLLPLLYGLNDPNIMGFQEINKNSLTEQQENRKLNSILHYPLQCISTSSELMIAAQLNISTTRASSQYMNKLEGCGLAVYNTNYTDSNFSNTSAYSKVSADFPTDDKVGLFCVTCKPGYKAYYWNNQKNVVRYCEKIEGCVSQGNWFNACEQCQDGYLHSYDSINGIQFDKCVKAPQNIYGLYNCYAYQQNSSTDYSGKCRVCMKGYFLNKDNYCEQITSPKCSKGQFQHYDLEIANIKNIKWAYYLYQNGYGCTECYGGSFALDIQSLSVKEYCIHSEYISYHNGQLPNQADKQESNYIQHCQMYTNDYQSLKCSRCEQNFVLREDGSECIDFFKANNCQLVENYGTNCIKCQEGYALLTTGQCILGNISNCIDYYSDESKSQMICKQCLEGFYLKNDDITCEQGLVEGCKYYMRHEQLLCQECYEGLVLTQDNKFCFQKVDQMNCKNPIITSEGYKCSQSECAFPWSQLVQNFDNSQNFMELRGTVRGICQMVNKIENCKVHSQLTSSWTEFSCKECEQNFYLRQDHKECLLRQHQDPNCNKYELDKDQCKVCYDGFYIKTVSGINKCIESPNGEQNCQIYNFKESTGLICSVCKSGFYLQNNVCIKIPSESIIKDCELYSGLGTCQKCNQNYVLENNTCVRVSISNCIEYENANSCKVCVNGFRLIKQENGFVCESFIKPNCQLYEQSGNNKCLQCSQDFYPNIEGDCVNVTNKIPECLQYISDNLCLKCTKQYVLSQDGSQCIKKEIFDENCEQQNLTSELQCNLCRAGYQIKGTSCQANLMNGPNSGCFMPDQQDQSVCYVCQAGYQMDEARKCKINQRNSKQEQDEKDQEKSVKLTLVFYAIFMIFI